MQLLRFSSPVPSSRLEDKDAYVSLFDFAVSSGVSLTTLRRKIKAGAIPYKIDKGKYWIKKNTLIVPEGSGVHSTTGGLPSGGQADAVPNELLRENQRLRDKIEELTILVRALEERFQVQY